jgi:hypothetical protein
MRGLISFCAVCAIGMVANVGIAAVLFQQKYTWWLAATAGIFMGAIWNYTATSIFTWKNVRSFERPAASRDDAALAPPNAKPSSASHS